jgi:hypothetical protein
VSGWTLLAFFVGGTIATTELVSEKYPNTAFTVLNCKYLWWRALVFALAAAALFLLWDQMVLANKIELNGTGFDRKWVQALIVGLTTKSLLQVNVFTLRVGPQTVPLGMATFLQPIEPPLTKKILLHEFLAVRRYVMTHAPRYPDLTKVKADILAAVPPGWPDDEKKALIRDVESAASVEAAMTLMLRALGRDAFAGTFP